MTDSRYTYQTLLAETDTEAREEYQVDPRVYQYATRNADTDIVNPIGGNVKYAGIDEDAPVIYETEADTLAVAVQDKPPTVNKKTIVIIDTAQRDWTKQPDAYSNIFAFGTQTPVSVAGPQLPYYFNNSNVPYAAYDMIYRTPKDVNPVVQRPNNKAYTFDASENVVLYQPFQNNGLLAKVWGWRLVIDPTGRFKHSVGPTGPEPILPTDRVVYFPVYDPTESRGSLIGVEEDPSFRKTNNIGFSTQLVLSNVTSLKLARATLPVRKFDSYDASVFSSTSEGSPIFNTFHNDPYILMTIENMKGQYFGAGQVVQNAFTALVQQQRNVIETTGSAILGQFQDYYPWSDESFKFDPPLGFMSNAAIALSNNNGEAFSHLDDLNALIITFGTSSTNNKGQGLGVLNFALTRNRLNSNFVAGSTDNIFAVSDVRVGDEIGFYEPTIGQILNDPSVNDSLYYFLDNLGSNGVIVTEVFSNALPGYPMVTVGYSFNAVLKTTTFQNTIDTYTNISALVNSSGLYQWTCNLPGFPDISGSKALVLSDLSFFGQSVNGTLLGDYVLPMINLNMQAAYAFEIITAESDSSVLNKIAASK